MPVSPAGSRPCGRCRRAPVAATCWCAHEEDCSRQEQQKRKRHEDELAETPAQSNHSSAETQCLVSLQEARWTRLPRRVRPCLLRLTCPGAAFFVGSIPGARDWVSITLTNSLDSSRGGVVEHGGGRPLLHGRPGAGIREAPPATSRTARCRSRRCRSRCFRRSAPCP